MSAVAVTFTFVSPPKSTTFTASLVLIGLITVLVRSFS